MVETSVIILTWNQKDLTIACIHSLLKQKYKDYEVILVDNGSEDGTPEAIKKEFGKKVKVVALKENRGFTGGNNEGVRNCSKSSKYIMLLNNDTIVPDNLLFETVKSIKSSNNIGAVTVPVYNKGMEKETQKMLDNNLSATSNLFTEQITIKIDKKLKNNHFIFYASGTCFLYKKNIVKLPFDEDYFIYSEEIYLGLLLHLLGYNIILCKTTSIFHENSAVKKNSSKKIKNYFKFLGRRNRLYNQLLFFERKTLLKLIPLLFLYNLFETLFDIKNIHIRIKAYFYIIFNLRKVLKKRRKIQKLRKLDDNEFLKKFSCKFVSENRFSNKYLKILSIILNKISKSYCFIFNIRTLEFYPEIQDNYGIKINFDNLINYF